MKYGYDLLHYNILRLLCYALTFSCNTSQFKGRYHVLNGLISPIDGVGPADLKIDSLIEKIRFVFNYISK